MQRINDQKNKYIAIFNTALSKYVSPDINTRGYQLTLFSHLRHSFQNDKILSTVLRELNKLDNESAKEYISNYLLSATKNNHSFACYFIDELVKSDIDHSNLWLTFNPKPIVFYDCTTNTSPYLYRGMRLTEFEALTLYVNGMECIKTDMDTLASTHTWNFGISTSKSYEATFAYAAPIITDLETGRALMHGDGWIFEIDARLLPKSSLIDIIPTSEARGNKEWERNEYGAWFASVVGRFLAAQDEEVNVIESIPANAIHRLFKIDRPSGNLVKVYENANTLANDIKQSLQAV